MRAAPHKELSVAIPKEVTSSLGSAKGPIVVKIQNEGGVAEISKEQGEGPIVENIQINLPQGAAVHDEAQEAQSEEKPASGAAAPELKEKTQKIIPESKLGNSSSLAVLPSPKLRLMLDCLTSVKPTTYVYMYAKIAWDMSHIPSAPPTSPVQCWNLL